MASNENVLPNTVKLLGEAVLPGASLIISGRIGAGLLHTTLGVAAGALLGPLGLIGRVVPVLIAANSFSRSVNDRNIWEGISNRFAGEEKKTTPE